MFETCQSPDAATGSSTAAVIVDKDGYAKRWLHSKRAVDTWIAEGLPCLRIGTRRVRIVVAEADEWMKRRFGQQRAPRAKAQSKEAA